MKQYKLSKKAGETATALLKKAQQAQQMFTNYLEGAADQLDVPESFIFDSNKLEFIKKENDSTTKDKAAANS